eukprot:2555869-Rhodomonas_salina.1
MPLRKGVMPPVWAMSRAVRKKVSFRSASWLLFTSENVLYLHSFLFLGLAALWIHEIEGKKG